MKLAITCLLAFFLGSNSPLWLTDFTKAKLEAKQANKYMLLNFSGSDWCTPCIRMHKTIFESPSFETFAEKELVLVNADFPRLKKHQLTTAQQKENDNLAEQYNPSGKFPYTLLINNDGKLIKAWEGCPDETPEKFVEEINIKIHGNK